MEIFIKKYEALVDWWLLLFWNIKIKEFDNKILDSGGLVKKTDYDAKISEIEQKYITTSVYKKFIRDVLDARIKINN